MTRNNLNFINRLKSSIIFSLEYSIKALFVPGRVQKDQPLLELRDECRCLPFTEELIWPFILKISKERFPSERERERTKRSQIHFSCVGETFSFIWSFSTHTKAKVNKISWPMFLVSFKKDPFCPLSSPLSLCLSQFLSVKHKTNKAKAHSTAGQLNGHLKFDCSFDLLFFFIRQLKIFPSLSSTPDVPFNCKSRNSSTSDDKRH